MTSKKAMAKWGRRRKRLRPFRLYPKDYDGRWKRHLMFNKLLNIDTVDAIRHLEEDTEWIYRPPCPGHQQPSDEGN